MQNSRSRFRSRRSHDRSATDASMANEKQTQTLNGRWTGYHPTLAEAVTRARLEALIESQQEDGQDD